MLIYQRRIPDMDLDALRTKVNKAIFSKLPKALCVTEDMADLKSFKTLPNLEKFLISRHWCLKEERQNICKINDEEIMFQAVEILKETHKKNAVSNLSSMKEYLEK